MQKERFSKAFPRQTLAVGCVAAASREKRAENKASFRFKTFYRMTMAAMLGQRRR